MYTRAVSVGYLFQRRKGASPLEACMDASRLKSLDWSFSSVRSRRDLTRLLYGLVLSGPLALLGAGEAHAKPHKQIKRPATCNLLGGPGRLCDRCPQLCKLPPL